MVLAQTLDVARTSARASRDAAHAAALSLESQRAQVVALAQSLERMGGQRGQLDSRLGELAAQLSDGDSPVASLENERCALHLKTTDGRDITCVQIAGLIARRILNYVDAGAVLHAGQRYGFIRFGSRVDLYLPLDSKVKVVIGEKVSATSTVLAELA